MSSVLKIATIEPIVETTEKPKKTRKSKKISSLTRGQAVSARIVEIDAEIEELFEERKNLLSDLDSEIAKLQNLRNFKRSTRTE